MTSLTKDQTFGWVACDTRYAFTVHSRPEADLLKAQGRRLLATYGSGPGDAPTGILGWVFAAE